jgi:hypothetical protein
LQAANNFWSGHVSRFDAPKTVVQVERDPDTICQRNRHVIGG